MYWRFEFDDLEPASSLVAAPSATGDECHRNIHGLSRKKATQEFYRLLSEDDLRICDEGDGAFSVEKVLEIRG